MTAGNNTRLRERGPTRIGERGVSVMEVIIAMGVMGIVMAAFYSLVSAGGQSSASQISMQQQQSMVLNTMNQISRHVTNSAPIVKAGGRELITQSPRNEQCVGSRYILVASGSAASSTYAKYGDVLLYQERVWDATDCNTNPVGGYTWPALPTFNDNGLATGGGNSQVLVTRVKLDKDQPLFKYVGAKGEDLGSTPAMTLKTKPNTSAISRVDFTVNAFTVNDGYVTLTTTAVPRNHIPGASSIGEILPPICPAVRANFESGVVSLAWPPTENASAYTITRTRGNQASVVATLPTNPGGLPTGSSPGLAPQWRGNATQNPFWSEDASTFTGGVLTYTVTATSPNGVSPACTPSIISVQMQAPAVSVVLKPDAGVLLPGWDGNRSTTAAGNQPASSAEPYFEIKWGLGTGKNQPIPGASGYSIQMLEINPANGNAIDTAWRQVPGGASYETNPSTTTLTLKKGHDGLPLWGREFKFRVQVLSGSGNSKWSTLETNSSGAVTGQNGTVAANRGYLVYPAAPEISTTAGGVGTGRTDWKRDASLNAVNKRDTLTFTLQRTGRNGVDAQRAKISYAASSWSNVAGRQNNASTTFGDTGLNPGDITDYRVQACNSGWAPLKAGVQCGPFSRVSSNLQAPSGGSHGERPNIVAMPNSGNRGNGVYWGKVAQANSPAGFQTQLVNTYSVQVKNTSEANGWNNLWRSTGSTSATEWGKAPGDFAIYQVQACNTTTGISRMAGGGCGAYSASNTGRAWQTPAAPYCASSATWNSVSAWVVRSGSVGQPGYVNPLSGQQGSNVSFSGGYTGGTYYANESGTWGDPSPEIRPNTWHTNTARVLNDAGWSEWGPNCGPLTGPPPGVGTPTMSSSRSNRTISWNWNQPVNAGFYQTVNSNATSTRYIGTGRSISTYNNPYGQQQCAKVRAAYNERLASWGYWTGFSNTSCQTVPNPPPPPPPPPPVGGGGTGGGGSGGIAPQCASYVGIGPVKTLLRIAGNNYGVQLGEPTSGSMNADGASHLRGSWATGDLSCNFRRTHFLLDSNGQQFSTATLSAVWSQGKGSGAV